MIHRRVHHRLALVLVALVVAVAFSACGAFSSEEDRKADYMNGLRSILKDYQGSFDELSGLVEEAQQDPDVASDEAWQAEMDEVLAAMRSGNSQLRALEPPAVWDEGHAEVIEAADYFDQALDLLEEALDEKSVDKVDQSRQLMTAGFRSINEGVDMMLE